MKIMSSEWAVIEEQGASGTNWISMSPAPVIVLLNGRQKFYRGVGTNPIAPPRLSFEQYNPANTQ
jgi:hypothetical protein